MQGGDNLCVLIGYQYYLRFNRKALLAQKGIFSERRKTAKNSLSSGTKRGLPEIFFLYTDIGTNREIP